jgi:hypothetical protein
MFYVDYKPASQEIISGKGIKENMKIPLVDFKVTNYRMPIILLTGYKASTVCEFFIPYLYSMLIDEVNKGKKYPKVIRYFENKKAMTEKYADQYVDELEIYFPEIEKRATQNG